MQSIPLTVSGGGSIHMEVSGGGSIPMELDQVRVVYYDRPAYTGDYTVTPSTERQILQTNGKRMTDDLVIEPIPNNYGLVTWDGVRITIT